MASSDKEIEQQLVEAGNRLTDPPSSVDDLLPLLDQVEHCLSKVEQSPPKSMQNALCPSLKALVSDQFFKHSNVDVKVAVASCISEITRITAPDAPYDDEQMKEVFQLIVSSFENLADKSSRSYNKRTSILETVAKVRSCVVMLDLECDALINEMFQHFLKAIRDYHPENVFSSMETIMTLVLEESEDISLQLLSPILASVKKVNEEVTPIAQKLAERVLESCATKLKPYVIQTVKSLGISLDDYGIVVASICQETSGAVEQNDDVTINENVADESNSVRASAEEAAEVDKEIATEAAAPEQADPTIDRSPKSAVSNGVPQTGEEDFLADSYSIKKEEHDHLTEQSKIIDTSSNAELGSLDTEKAVIAESKQEQTSKKKGKRSNSLKLTEPSDTALIDGEKEADTLPDNKDSSKDVPSSPCDDPSIEAAMSSEDEKETGIQLSSPKAIEGEPMNVASPSPSVSLPDENRSKKAGRLKKKESLMKEAAPSADDVSKKASEGSSDSEAKPGRRSGKKVASRISNEDETPAVADTSKKPSEGTSDSEAKPTRCSGKRVASGITNEDETPAVADASKKESGIASDSEAKPLKQSAKKVDASSNNAEESSKQTDDKKRRSRGKTISKKDSSKTSTKDEDKEMVSSPKSAKKSSKDEHHLEETPKTNSKRKRTPGKDQASDKEYGEDIVGSKVKVWWPRDHMYYKGVIGSFDPIKKKHMVFYNDGDEENLNLKRERWEFIESDSESDEEEAADRTSLNDSSELPLKKKAKTISDQSTKQGKKMDALPKRGGGSSSKTKAATTKSGRKSKYDNKVESKSKDVSKAVGKSEISLGKSKDHAAKSSGKPVDVASKPASKSKNDDGGTPKSGKSKDGSGTLKTFTKSKQDTLKTSKSNQETTKISSGKGKPSKSGSKSTVNGSGKLKSGSSKAKESEDAKEDSSYLAKSQENTKGKSPSSSKAQGSEAKSGKKRRR